MPETEPAANPATPTAHRRFFNAEAAWPVRKRMAVGVITPVLFVLTSASSGGQAFATSPGWTALIAVVALICALTLATYLPRAGTVVRLDFGCTPCAAVAALTVLASLGLLSSAPGDVSTAVLALGVAGFGLVQRLNNPSTCPA